MIHKDKLIGCGLACVLGARRWKPIDWANPFQRVVFGSSQTKLGDRSPAYRLGS